MPEQKYTNLDTTMPALRLWNMLWYVILHWENIGDDIGEERLLGCDSFAEMKIVKILINNLWAIPSFTNCNNVKLEPNATEAPPSHDYGKS